MKNRIGQGFDVHRLKVGTPLTIGGVSIPYPKGSKGHSDGDVLYHAIVDAIIGAMGVGDIGRHFPDTDTKWKDYSSIRLLRHVVELVHSEGLKIVWIDSVIMAERPKLASHISLMKDAISQAGILPATINIKAKTNEGMGFIGRGEGIAAQAVCLLMQA